MATPKKSGGWSSSMGGTNYKCKGGKVAITGTEAGKGTVSGLPSTGGEKKGQTFILGEGGGRGIPSKKSGNTTSDWAAKHD